MLLHLTVVEDDHTGVSVVLLLHLVFGIDALPLDLIRQDRQHTGVHEFIRGRSHQAFNEATANKRPPESDVIRLS